MTNSKTAEISNWPNDGRSCAPWATRDLLSLAATTQRKIAFAASAVSLSQSRSGVSVMAAPVRCLEELALYVRPGNFRLRGGPQPRDLRDFSGDGGFGVWSCFSIGPERLFAFRIPRSEPGFATWPALSGLDLPSSAVLAGASPVTPRLRTRHVGDDRRMGALSARPRAESARMWRAAT